METTLVMPTEDTLVCDALSADKDALDALTERLRPRAIAMAYAITGNRDDALDVAQSALLRVFAREESRSLRCPVISALYQTVHNTAIDLLKQDRRRSAREGALRNEPSQRSATMPEQQLEQQELIDALRKEMASLPAETAAVIALHHMDDLSVHEVSKRTGLTVDACKHRLSRGRDELRQRLERRGIALAGVALLAGLNEVFFAGKACAAEIAANAASFTSGNAATSNAGSAPTSPRGSGTSGSHAGATPQIPPTSGASIATRIKTPRRLNPAQIAGASPRSHAGLKGVVAAVAILALLAAMTLLKTPSRPRMPVTAAQDPHPRPTAGPDVPTAAGAGSRWASADVCDGRMVPLSLSTAGQNVSLLTCEIAESALKSHRAADNISLFVSQDGGRKWTRRATMNAYSYGTILRTGNEHLGIGLVNKIGHGYHSTPHANSYFLNEFLRADWLVIDAAGKARSEPLFDATAKRPLAGPVTLLRAGDANWVFARRYYKDNDFTKFDLLAARGIGIGTPAPVAIKRTGRATFSNEHPPAAWAIDHERAGCIFTAEDQSRLIHTYTLDGGKTWTDVAIPFAFDTNSGGLELRGFEPIALAREGERLVLYFTMSYDDTASTDAYDYGWRQEFTIASDDLGKTWKAAQPVTTPFKPESSEANPVSLDIKGDRFIIAANGLVRPTFRPSDDPDRYSLECENAPRHVVVKVSTDAGATWSDVKSLDAKDYDCTDVVLQSSDQGVFIALRKVTPANFGMLPAQVKVQRLIGTSDEIEKSFVKNHFNPTEASPNF